jgi:glucose/arabinose dehydrogenase/cytochrome c2
VHRKRLLLGLCLVVSFALGLGLGKFGDRAFHNHFGFSVGDFIRSPLAHFRVHQRGWGSFEEPHYTQDHCGADFRRNIETALLPLTIEGKCLSDYYPVPKMGGAIAVAGTAVIILDRLGRLYSYDLKTGVFGLLPIPKLANKLEEYLVQRPGPPVNLADARNDEFRARSITFLSDREELAVAYDKFDETLGKLRTVVSVISFDVEKLTATGDWRQIFSSDAFAYFDGITAGAGILAYRGDGRLYLTLGDHYTVDPKLSEDPRSTFGKIIEINIAKNEWRVVSKGHRNQEGLTFRKSGQLVSTEHGPFGGDELNVIEDGGDYGWPNVTLGTAYNSYDWPAGTSVVGRHTGYKAPLFAWVPSIAVSQLIEINNFHARWDGDLLVGSLKASSLYRLRFENDRVLYSERIWLGERIRYLAQTNDGAIVAWTDDAQLLFITVDTDLLAVKRRTPDIVSRTIVDALVNEHCLVCHHFGSTNPTDFAPSLSGLLNRPIASDAFSYTQALRAKQKLGNWTPALLSEFLSDPYKFASGTNMVPQRISPAEIEDIVATLARASDRSAEHRQSPYVVAPEGPDKVRVFRELQ